MSEQENKTEASIEIFLTNLGKYNENHLVGEWISLPITPSDFHGALERIGIDGQRYEEYFITDYESSFKNLFDRISPSMMMYASIEELNYLASKIDDIPVSETAKFQSALEYGEHTSTVAELINLATYENLCKYDLFAQIINDDEALGRYLIEDSGVYGVYDLDSLGVLADYIDYERFGRDTRIVNAGAFTERGYLLAPPGLKTYYSGKDDIPNEYRLRKMPEEKKPSILGQIKNFQEKIKDDNQLQRQNEQIKNKSVSHSI